MNHFLSSRRTRLRRWLRTARRTSGDVIGGETRRDRPCEAFGFEFPFPDSLDDCQGKEFDPQGRKRDCVSGPMARPRGA